MNKYISLFGAAHATNIRSLAQLGSGFVIDSETQLLTNECVQDDFLDLAYYFGIDMETTWTHSGNTDKNDLWAYLNFMDGRLNVIKSDIGIDGQEVIPNLVSQIDTSQTTIETAIETARVEMQGTRGYNLEHIVYFVKQSEINQTDMLHEMVDRLRFLTDRLELIEEALGGDYLYGTGEATESYGAYQSDLIEDSPHVEADVVAEYDNNGYVGPQFELITYFDGACTHVQYASEPEAKAVYDALVIDSSLLAKLITDGNADKIFEAGEVAKITQCYNEYYV